MDGFLQRDGRRLGNWGAIEILVICLHVFDGEKGVGEVVGLERVWSFFHVYIIRKKGKDFLKS